MSRPDTIDAFLATVLPDASPSATVRRPPQQVSFPALPLLSMAEATDVPTVEPSQLILQRTLGRGGMGVVFLAEQPHLDRQVAVKRLPESATQGTRHALIHEARTLGALDHPNVIPIHALGVGDDEQPAMVMKRVDGVTWTALIDDPDHPRWATRPALIQDLVSRQVAVLIEVCNAIGFAHSRGIIHRDIKPDNVMIGAHGQVYVVDWGLATPLDSPVGPIAGSPSYLAPEVLDPISINAATIDVFGLGATLHHALTGQPRHAGTTIDTVLRSAARCAAFAYPPLVPAELAAICNRATARSPADRMPSVEALVEALVGWQQHLGSVRLTHSAAEQHRRLDAMLDSGAAGEIALAEAYWSAHFGYLQALDAWTDNTEAEAGLIRLVEGAFVRAVARSEPHAAAARLAELDALEAPTAALHETLSALKSTLANERRRSFDPDQSAAATQRLPLFAFLMVASAVVAAAVVRTGTELDVAVQLGVASGLAILVMGAIAVFREPLFLNPTNRRISLSVLVTLSGIVVHRAVTFLDPDPQRPEDMLAGDLMILGVATVTIGAFLGPRLVPVALVFVLGAIGAAWIPQLAGTIMVVATVTAPALLYVVIRQKRGPIDTP